MLFSTLKQDLFHLIAYTRLLPTTICILVAIHVYCMRSNGILPYCILHALNTGMYAILSIIQLPPDYCDIFPNNSEGDKSKTQGVMELADGR